MVYLNFLLVVGAGSVQIITDLDPDPRGPKSLVRTHLGLCPGVTMVCAEKDHGYPSMQLFSIIQGINWNIQANSWQTCTHSCQHWNRNKCTKCIYLKYSIWLFFFISRFFGFAGTTASMFIKIYAYVFTSLRKTYNQSETSALLHDLHIDWNHCRGSGSGIRYFFDLCIGDSDRGWKEYPGPDPEWKNSDPGSGTNPGSATLIETQDNNKKLADESKICTTKICSRKKKYEEKTKMSNLTKLLLSKQ